MPDPTVLSPQQVAFYEAFGFLRLPGLFAGEMEAITAGFEAVFADQANPQIPIDVDLHRNEPRIMVPQFIDRHPALAGLRTDPRVVGIADDLLGPGAEFAESDGNLYWCDSEWHCDVYGSPLEVRHVKLSFYLDPLHAGNGAVRLIPGTNHWTSDFATGLRRNFLHLGQIPEMYGVEGDEIPCVVLDSQPGDLLLWDFRTLHAVYHGMERRRLFTINFREAQHEPAASSAG